MGTSTGYKMPTGGDWKPLKDDATRYAKDGIVICPTDRLISNYLNALGKVGGIAGSPTAKGGGSNGGGTGGGNRGGGGGKSSKRGVAPVRVARNLGRFLSTVTSSSLADALTEVGLAHLIGHPATEIFAGLLDVLVGPASTQDDHIAREALDDLKDELLDGALSAEELEAALKANVDEKGLSTMIGKFFSIYIYKRFCRDFYEIWVKKVGSDVASSRIRDIKDYIQTRFDSKMERKDINRMELRGDNADRIVRDILADTCAVYEVLV